MSIKIPPFLIEHPFESLVAVGLLLGLLFISADGSQPSPAGQLVQVAAGRN
ncbi:MAG: hypothetical protein JO256_13625 [Alphaproteobacteria bacterium]|nr:hypothetical protein [Alphaproteobacteria bacterium]